MHIHILGICGTFIGGLALIARSAGFRVTGCDQGVYPPMSTQLEEQGIKLIEGFAADQTKLKPDLFVIGNVITRGNPLMEEILNQGLPYTSGTQWLGDYILRNQHVFAVAGTHGKTTTSAMLAWILQETGQTPNFLIGGIAPDLGVSAHYKKDQRNFVIEADEYDTAFFDKRSKFLHYHARTAILNNLEFDHADIFPNLNAIETQFHHLVRTTPDNACIIRPKHNQALDRVLEQGCWTPIQYLNTKKQWDYHLLGPNKRQIRLNDQEQGTIEWALQGEHNAQNALAAIAASTTISIQPKAACAALSRFNGIKRRMELRGSINDIKVLEDFAHHNTALTKTLKGARSQLTGQQGNQSGRLIAVLEPRSNTMRDGVLVEKLPTALAHADLSFCYHETKGKHALKWDPKVALSTLGERLSVVDNFQELAQVVANTAQPHDTIVVMSNGYFGNIHERILRSEEHTS